MTTTLDRPDIIGITPETLSEWLSEERAVLVDVRDDYEHAMERIQGAEHVPIAELDPEALRRRFGDTRIVFQCTTGKRSAEAARRVAEDDKPAFHLVGGLEAWRASGRTLVRNALAPRIGIMRQVQITAGSLVLIGVLLGVLVTPWLLLLSGFVGAGLVFAGVSGWCGMARFLAILPWNRVSLNS